MLDRINNKILHFLEVKNWRLSNVYWKLVGKHIPYWM